MESQESMKMKLWECLRDKFIFKKLDARSNEGVTKTMLRDLIGQYGKSNNLI